MDTKVVTDEVTEKIRIACDDEGFILTHLKYYPDNKQEKAISIWSSREAEEIACFIFRNLNKNSASIKQIIQDYGCNPDDYDLNAVVGEVIGILK